MDATGAVVVTTRIKSVDVLASSVTRRMSSAKIFIQPTKPENLSFPASIRSVCSSFRIYQRAQQSNSSHRILSLTHCSMKPGIDSNNAKNKNAAIEELVSNSTTQPLLAPPSDNGLSSTSSRGLVFDLGPSNSWDSAEIGSPVVKRYIGDDEERWYMWYHGTTGNSDSIGLAASNNGIHWSRGVGPVRSCGDVGMVMNCSKNWWAFDTKSIRPSELVIMSSPMYSAVYWLYYTGYSSEEIELPHILKVHPENGGFGKIFKSLPGLACSQDGRHWARIEGEHHSGAVLDVGSSKEWDSLFIATPKVVTHSSDDFRMYYHSFDAENGHFAIGAARSRDGIRWVKLGKILGGGSIGSFDELGAMNAYVVKNQTDGKYLMAFEGVAANGERSIGLAESPDGLKNWNRIQEDHVLKPSEEDGWDNKGLGFPCLVQMNGNSDEWRLYYRGVGKGGRTGIGLAVSEGSNLRRFRRWAGLTL